MKRAVNLLQQLSLSRIKCLEETNEVGADEIYFVTAFVRRFFEGPYVNRPENRTFFLDVAASKVLNSFDQGDVKTLGPTSTRFMALCDGTNVSCRKGNILDMDVELEERGSEGVAININLDNFLTNSNFVGCMMLIEHDNSKVTKVLNAIHLELTKALFEESNPTRPKESVAYGARGPLVQTMISAMNTGFGKGRKVSGNDDDKINVLEFMDAARISSEALRTATLKGRTPATPALIPLNFKGDGGRYDVVLEYSGNIFTTVC